MAAESGSSGTSSSKCLFCGTAGGKEKGVRTRLVTVSWIFHASIPMCEECGKELAKQIKDAIVTVYAFKNPKRSILVGEREGSDDGG